MKNRTVQIRRILIAALVGGTAALIFGVLLTCGVSWLIGEGVLKLNYSSVSGFLFHLISSVIGCLLGGRLAKEKKLLTCILSEGWFYFLLLAITILLFDGVFSGVIASVGGGALGCLLSVWLFSKQNKPASITKKIKKYC